MPYMDLHDNPFDDSTLIKLSIFEEYAEAWLPTFVMANHPTICIFDFFAGTGYDKNGIPGSPIRILEKIKYFLSIIRLKGTRIHVYFNEFMLKKFALLEEACNKYLEENPDVKAVVQLHLSQEDFEVCFNRLFPEIVKYPSLVYLDQNGVKFLADRFLLALEKTDRTDFLYFVSSSYIKRFGDSDEFKKHLNFDMERVAKGGPNYIHRNIITQLYEKLPANSKLRLYPFSLKKGTNIYGIIFGAKNALAVEKFLDIAWKRNPINGDANFDLDEDNKKGQLDIFDGKKMTKIESFENDVMELIRQEKVVTNALLHQFAMDRGHSHRQMSELLRSLKKQGLVYFDGTSPKVSYDHLKYGLLEIKWEKK